MEILDYLNEEISKIEKDNRFNYPKANICNGLHSFKLILLHGIER